MLKVKLSTKASLDIRQGIKYYNKQQAGLGRKFEKSIKRTINRIQQLPEAASFATSEARYKPVEKFPYIILYVFDEKNIRIARVFNTHLDETNLD
jgi:plasmid stabilization system protein ParE